jgi:hypothetical protein
MNEPLRSRQERLATNQALYRTVNEKLRALNGAFEEAARIGGEWVCECADTDCTAVVSAQASEYEAIRANPRTFIVYPGHVFPEVERVVGENERFAIVEKFGAGAEVAEQTYGRAPARAEPTLGRGA